MADNPIEQMHEAIEQAQGELESRRFKFLRLFLLGALVIILIVLAMMYQISEDRQAIYLPTIIFSLFGSMVLFQILDVIYVKSTKKLFMDKITEATGLEYEPGGVFAVGELEKHRILPVYDHHRVEDGFKGEYKGVPIEFEEIVLSDLERDPQHKNKMREVMNFWGMGIRLKLRKPTEGHTVIIPRNAIQTFYRTKFTDFQRIKLVSNKFEKKYDVMGTDQVEARVILDPAFMERFMEAGEIFKAKWIEVSFKDDEIVFLILRYRPMFEVGHLWTVLSQEHLKRTVHDLEAVLHVVDTLRLNPQVPI